jgi:hypothetical protein
LPTGRKKSGDIEMQVSGGRPMGRGAMVSMMEGEVRPESTDLFLVVQELALRVEPVVKVTAVFPPSFLISLVRALRDRIIGRRAVSRRWAVDALNIVPKGLDR